MVKESKSKRMLECSKCGATDNIASSGYICKQCKKLVNQEYRKNTKEPVARDMTKELLRNIINTFESGKVTKTQFELIYIDSCKLIGHDRKDYIIRQRRMAQGG